MKIKLPQQLSRLAHLLDSPLYVVGGYVRNAFMGLDSEDIDLAGRLTPDEVVSALEGSAFKAVTVNKRLGTLKICIGNEGFEYTCFREDSYPEGGSHSPERVRFTKDISADALRRDFKANAVYYDILNQEIIDPLGGAADIERRILSAVRSPDGVFCQDGLRIMRLARQSAELGFTPEAGTSEAARRHAPLIKDISPERIKDELIKIMFADKKYPALGLDDAHERGIRLLDSAGVLRFILPELWQGKGFDQKSAFHCYDVFEHTLTVFRYSPPEVRLAALFHDSGKPRAAVRDGNMKGHAQDSESIAKERLGERGLRFPLAEVEKTAMLVALHMYDLDCQETEAEVRLFIVKHAKLMPDLIKLKRADMKGSIMPFAPSESADRLEKLFTVMKEDGTPFTTAELRVDGRDLIAEDITDKERGRLLNSLLEQAVIYPEMRTREAQLSYIRNAK